MKNKNLKAYMVSFKDAAGENGRTIYIADEMDYINSALVVEFETVIGYKRKTQINITEIIGYDQPIIIGTLGMIELKQELDKNEHHH